MKTKAWKSIQQLLTMILYFIILIAVVILMSYVQNLLNSDVKINLSEIVTQNKDVITSKLNLQVNDLDSVSSQIMDRMIRSDKNVFEDLKEVFLDYTNDRETHNLFLADKDGNAIFPDKTVLDISGRNYFRLAMQGIQNISDCIVSRKDGEDIFVISVPLKYQNEVIGSIQKYFTPKEMYELCSISLFSSEGYMYIINREGYILISSQHETYTKEMENYFRMLYAQGNQEAAQQLQNDVENKRNGFMETVLDGKKTFSAYTSIEAIHDWYLISSVSTSAVSPNANIVIKMFYFILFVVVFISGASIFAFFVYKKKQQASLERIAFVDNVTHGDTFNKFTLDMKVALHDYPEKSFYLLKFDIDNFKYVNNFYGFDFGDRILFQIYQVISRKLSEVESIARISSDHFIILLENAEESRLNDLLCSVENEEGILLYFSAGLYEITDRSESINLMIDKASTAASTAKGVLKKKVEIYSEKFDQLMIRNEQLKRSVKQALADNEIIPYFQPKINVNTEKMEGAEALARWQKKDGTLVPPNDFIPLCEKTGMITELDMVVFEQVLAFIQKNMEAGIECVPISVNFSRLHLLDSDFFSKVVSMIRKYNVPADLIELELTESAIFDNYEMISQLISQLHSEGFLISMDDFGSGYSSLNMLKDIAIDVLKIDKDFLKSTTNSGRQSIIFSAIAQMANQLKIKVVVEGVETLEHVRLMKEVNCQVAQGYFYAKPMCESNFEKIYKGGFGC